MWFNIPNATEVMETTTTIDGITYRTYPTAPKVRTGWVVALGVEDWVPRAKSAATQGTANLGDNGEPATSLACRICLATNLKLYPISNKKLKQAYENVTGISLQAEDRLPQKLCAECAQRVLSCDRFRSRALRANSLMRELASKQERLTLQDIRTLSVKNFRLDRSETHVTEEEKPPAPVIQEELASSTIAIEQEHMSIETEDIIVEQADDFLENELQAYEFLSEDIQVDLDKEFDIASDKNELSVTLQSVAKKLKTESEVTVKKRIQNVKKVIEPAESKADERQTIRRKQLLLDDGLDEMFTITDLSYDEQVADILKRQDSSNYKNCVYKCNECFKGFVNEDAYRNHMIRHTNKLGIFECEICKVHVKTMYALRKHIKAYHTQRYSCNECPYVTPIRHSAKKHVRFHKGTKYSCPHCPSEFLTSTTYFGHLRIVHPSDFSCEICGYSFVSAKGIAQHKKLTHIFDNAQIPEDGPFCELCNVRFVCFEAYKRHLSISPKHTAGQDRSVRNVNTEKAKIYRLISKSKKKPEGPITCKQCGLQLPNSRAHYAHFRQMHPDQHQATYPANAIYMCEVCGKMFKTQVLLQNHRYTHTGEAPYKCDTCGKAFRMKVLLMSHLQVHSEQRKTYPCKICGKHFTLHCNRKRHMAVHSAAKPFECQTCGKGFKSDVERKAHTKYVHLKMPYPKRVRGKRQADPTLVLKIEIDP